VGAVALFLLYLLVLWRAYRIAVTAKDPFGTYVSAAVAFWDSTAIRRPRLYL
jgi:cell division protein FtsW (lipid II flippase)